MASGNLSPRQKMINVMYLVLIALLALNVSKEILKSFHMIEVSFNKAQDNLDAKIGEKMKGLEKSSKSDPTLVPYFNRAEQARETTDELVSYINGIIKELEDLTEGRKEYEGEQDPSTLKSYETELKGSDNIETHANYFFVDAEGGPKPGWRAEELEKRINETRENLIKLLEQDTANGIDIAEGIQDQIASASMLRAELEPGEKKYSSWSRKYLEHSPLAAVVTLLTKIQSDAKTTEAAVIDILAQGKETQYTIEELVPVVKTTSNIVMLGEEYKAEVFLAARTSGDENTTFHLEGSESELTKEGGKGIYTVTPNNQGTFTWGGMIKVKTKKGVEEYPFEAEYQAFQGQASISATKMNMLYIGVDNPISVAVPGVNPDGINATISSGSLRKKGRGSYIAKVTRPGNATISVSAKLSNGDVKTVGRMEYRVRRLPKPEAKWGTQEGGRPIPKAALLSQRMITAGMGPEFAFEGLRYRVTGYQFIYAPRRGEAMMVPGRSAAISGGMKNVIQRAKRGDRVIVEKIRASGPGGNVTLNPIILEIQ